jgi:hypothetical protein
MKNLPTQILKKRQICRLAFFLKKENLLTWLFIEPEQSEGENFWKNYAFKNWNFFITIHVFFYFFFDLQKNGIPYELITFQRKNLKIPVEIVAKSNKGKDGLDWKNRMFISSFWKWIVYSYWAWAKRGKKLLKKSIEKLKFLPF